MEEVLKKLGEKSKADEEAIAAAQGHFHAVSAGLSSNADGEDKTLADQLMGRYLLIPTPFPMQLNKDSF